MEHRYTKCSEIEYIKYYVKRCKLILGINHSIKNSNKSKINHNEKHIYIKKLFIEVKIKNQNCRQIKIIKTLQ